MKKAVVKDIEVFRTLYGAPFQDAKCDYCGEKSCNSTCPFCGYPKDIEFLEEDEPSKVG